VSRGRHRRPALVPERWWWFALVSLPAWSQLVAWPFLRHDLRAYNVGVAALGALFLLYLGYFVVNRRRHARLRRGNVSTRA
jgi:hypothetical protein